MHVRLYHVTWVPPLILRPALCWWTAKASTPAQRGPYVTPKQDEVLFFTLYAGLIVLPVHVYQLQAIPKCDLKTHWVKCWTNTKTATRLQTVSANEQADTGPWLKKKKKDELTFLLSDSFGLLQLEVGVSKYVGVKPSISVSTLLFFCFPFVFYFVYMDIWLTLTHSCDIPEAFWQVRLSWKKIMIKLDCAWQGWCYTGIITQKVGQKNMPQIQNWHVISFVVNWREINTTVP